MKDRNFNMGSGTKDNFSAQAKSYAQFRPRYPQKFYEFILANVESRSTAWDCATGNGQVAVELAKHFAKVYATDISSKQLANAQKRHNITYQLVPAERTYFDNDTFDLVTVAQAIHWLRFGDFFSEVKRVLRPNGLFLAVGYGLMKINPPINEVINKFYSDILGKYWDEERKHIENNYASIDFPFQMIECEPLSISATWNFTQLIGYLETWSSVQHYLRANSRNPIDLIINELTEAWGEEEQLSISFPLIIKAGRHA